MHAGRPDPEPTVLPRIAEQAEVCICVRCRALIWGFCFVLCVMMVTMYGYNVMEHGSGYWLCILTIFIWALT